MLSTTCEQGHTLTGPDRYVGKTSRCPSCGALVTFPMPQVAPADEFGGDDLNDMLSEVEELQRREKVTKRQQRQTEDAVERPEATKRRQKKDGATAASSPFSVMIAVAVLGTCGAIGILIGGLIIFAGGAKQKPDEVVQATNPVEVATPTPQVAVEQASTEIKAPADPAPKEVEFKGLEVKLIPKALPQAFDPNSGRLIVKSQDRHSPTWHIYQPGYFDGDEAAVRQIELPDPISAAGFKSWNGKDYLVVCVTPTPPKKNEPVPANMVLLDPATLQPIQSEPDLFASVVLDVNDPTRVSASQLDDPEFLISADRRSTLVNLRDGSKSRVAWNGAAIPKLGPSGHYIYSRHGRLLRTNRNLPTAGEGDLQFASSGEVDDVIDPFEEIGIAAGPTAQRGIRQLKSSHPASTPFPKNVEFRCFMQKLPWLVGSDAKQIHWLSRESGQPIVSVAAPLAKISSIFDDAGRRRLLLIGPDSAMAVSYEKIKFPASDAMVATLDLPERIAPGQTISVPFVSPTLGLKISQLEGPPTAKVTDGRLEWTPNENEIGLVQLKIRYEMGVDVKDDVIQRVVSRFPVPLSFEPRKFQVSTDGRHVVVWNSYPSVHGEKLDPPRVAVYDLETQQVTASTIWDHDITDLAASRDYVAVLSVGDWSAGAPVLNRQASSLNLYRLPDLKFERTEKLGEPATDIQALGLKTLLITRQSTKGGAAKPLPFVDANSMAVNLPELKPQPWDRFLNAQQNLGFGRTVQQAIDGRWIIGNMALGLDAEQVEGFFNAGHWQVPHPRFGHSVQGIGFAAHETKRSPTLLGDPSIAAPFKSASIQWRTEVLKRELGATSSIFVYDYANSEPQLVKVAWSTKTTWDNNFIPIALTKYGAVCVAEGLHIVPLTCLAPAAQDGTATARSLPFQVRAAARQFSVKSGGTVTFEASGGKPPYKFDYKNAFATPNDAIELNPIGAGEKVTVKYAKSYDALASELADTLVMNVSKKSAKEIVDGYQAMMYAAFAGLVEKSSSEIPWPREIGVTVTDSSGATLTLSHLIFLQIPEKAVLKQVQGRVKK